MLNFEVNGRFYNVTSNIISLYINKKLRYRIILSYDTDV